MRTKIYKVISHEFSGELIVGKEFDRLVQLMWEQLPSNLDMDNLDQSMRYLLGQSPTNRKLFELCWRLVGNMPRLKQRRTVTPWHMQRWREWVPLQITSARRVRSTYGRVGINFGFRVLAGTPSGMLIQRWWSSKQALYYARSMGFSMFGKKKGESPKYHYTDPAQLVQLRLYGLMEPDLCEKEPMFGSVEFPGAVLKHNREILRKRFRVDLGYACPEGFPRSFPCHHCITGYDTCAAATHAKSWQRKPCKDCGLPDALFDEEISIGQCVDCYNKAIYQRKT